MERPEPQQPYEQWPPDEWVQPETSELPPPANPAELPDVADDTDGIDAPEDCTDASADMEELDWPPDEYVIEAAEPAPEPPGAPAGTLTPVTEQPVQSEQSVAADSPEDAEELTWPPDEYYIAADALDVPLDAETADAEHVDSPTDSTDQSDLAGQPRWRKGELRTAIADLMPVLGKTGMQALSPWQRVVAQTLVNKEQFPDTASIIDYFHTLGVTDMNSLQLSSVSGRIATRLIEHARAIGIPEDRIPAPTSVTRFDNLTGTHVGASLDRARVAAGLTEQQYADMLGISLSSLQNMTHGKTFPSVSRVRESMRQIGMDNETIDAELDRYRAERHAFRNRHQPGQ